MAIVLVSVLLGLVTLIVSGFFVDFQLVLMVGQDKPWIGFLNRVIEYGGVHRPILAWVWTGTVVALLGMQIYFLTAKNEKTKDWIMAGAVLALLSAGAYPFLSKDIYTYLFSAKMVMDYGLNPYTVAPKAFLGKELWLDLMGSIERSYFYGPVYLGLSLLPMMILGTNRVLLLLLGYKMLNLIFWITGGWLVYKLSGDWRKTMAMWWFNPLLILELLVNGHNDLVMIVLFLAGVWLIERNKNWGWTGFAMSALTKWVSGGLVPVMVTEKYRKLMARIMLLCLFYFLIVKGSQVWYWTWMYMLLPMAEIKSNKSWMAIFVFQTILILGYGGFVVAKNWGALVPGLVWGYRLGYLLPLVVWRWEKSKTDNNMV